MASFCCKFLEQYCSEETDIEVSITTSERQDWYSEFCVENQIEVSLKKLSKVLVQVVAKPKGREQKSALLRALVEDEAWEVGGCLDIRVGDASIRPDGDGTSFNWTGPSALIPRVQEAIDSAAASNPVTLLHR